MSTKWVQKLTSRKLWVALIGVAVGLGMAFGVEGGEIEEVVAMVSGALMAFGSIREYIKGESSVDAARENTMNLTFGDGKTETGENEEA